jgi:hypothetical protein
MIPLQAFWHVSFHSAWSMSGLVGLGLTAIAGETPARRT